MPSIPQEVLSTSTSAKAVAGSLLGGLACILALVAGPFAGGGEATTTGAILLAAAAALFVLHTRFIRIMPSPTLSPHAEPSRPPDTATAFSNNE